SSCFLFVSSFFLESYGDRRDLHSFPTRRSSDLCFLSPLKLCATKVAPSSTARLARLMAWKGLTDPALLFEPWSAVAESCPLVNRSEEHTSELQSRENLVCRLLLEKKKEQQLRPA